MKRTISPLPALWFDTLTERPPTYSALAGDVDVDVAIVGAGYTGLWTAYYLKRDHPELNIAVLEAEHVGFGASGRNGGWCSALFPQDTGALEGQYGAEAAHQMRAAMNDSVVEVGRVAQAEGIDCDFVQGGTIILARTPQQKDRALAAVQADAARGGIDGLTWLDPQAASTRLRGASSLGGTYTPHCARLHPAKLVVGLAAAVTRMGVEIYEHTRVDQIVERDASGKAHASTERGTVSARHIVRATEAWTSQLPGSERDVVPVYSLVIATAPLPQEVWDTIGLASGETFSDHRHLIVYGQRTADDRLVFGGRGAPYHFGSGIHPDHDRDEKVFAGLYATLLDLFPSIAGYKVTHAWGGPLGIARDWHASVGHDENSGIGWAGGYVGDGVSTSNLAGRTLADLITGEDSPLTHLPWVGHQSPLWEPEPARWLMVNAGLRVMTMADSEENLTGKSSLLARLMAPLLGHHSPSPHEKDTHHG